MKTRKIALTHSKDSDTEPFIKSNRKHYSLQERHQQYLNSLSFYDRFLIKLQDWFTKNNIASSLISVVLIGLAFFVAFFCVITFLSNRAATKPSRQSLISYHNNNKQMASSSISSSISSSKSSKLRNNIIKKIKILLMSDIHLNKTNIAKVDKYIWSSNIKIDHLWVPGDFLSLKDEDNDDEKKLQQAEDELIDLLKDIKKIHRNPIIIPGNHDPKTLFATNNDKYLKFGDCINIHNQLYRVEGETNLFMAGFGGSIPAFCDSQIYWTGYPYINDEEFGKEYNEFIDGIINDKDDIIKTNKSIILFTHNGPSMCSTTMDWRMNDENKIITTGSMHIMKSMLNDKFRDKLICNIHGHAHLGFGQGHIGNVRIINPGSLKGGDLNNNFAFLDLVQLKDETWKVDNVEFKTVMLYEEHGERLEREYNDNNEVSKL